jgi:hypothetical protein
MQVRCETNSVEDGGPRRAFTLMELVVVMVLIAIMAAIAVPAMGNLTSTRTATAARQLARDATFARQQAGARAAVPRAFNAVPTQCALSASADTDQPRLNDPPAVKDRSRRTVVHRGRSSLGRSPMPSG